LSSYILIIKKVENKIESGHIKKWIQYLIKAKKNFVRKIGTFGIQIAKIATLNIMKDYTINSIVVPFLNLKLGISSKILVLVIVAFL